MRHTSTLTALQRQLLELFQQLNFGVLERLVVRDGEPVLDPPPRIVREYKFGTQNDPSPRSRPAAFNLKLEVSEFFEAITNLGDGVIDRVEFKHGLPFRMVLDVTRSAWNSSLNHADVESTAGSR